MAAAFAVELVRAADIAAVAWAAAQLQVGCGHWLAKRIGALEDFSNEERSNYEVIILYPSGLCSI